jgi:hypothetical protein
MGAGGSTSQKTSLDAVSEIIAESFLKSTQQCHSYVQVSQNAVISGNNNRIAKLKMDQKLTIDVACVQSSDIMRDMASKASNDINALVKNNSETFGNIMSDQKSETENRIKSSVITSIKSEDIQNMITSINLDQNFLLSGSGNFAGEIELIQNNSMFKTTSKQLAEKVLTNMGADQKVKTSTVNKQTGMLQGAAGVITSMGNALNSVMGGIFTGLIGAPILGLLMLVIFVIIFVVIIKILGSAFGGGGGDGDGGNAMAGMLTTLGSQALAAKMGPAGRAFAAPPMGPPRGPPPMGPPRGPPMGPPRGPPMGPSGPPRMRSSQPVM